MRQIFLQNQLAIPMETEPSFYMAGLGNIQSRLMQLREGDTLLILGHNYGWSDAVARLSGRHIELKTANIAVLEHSGTEWAEIIQETDWTLTHFITPRDIL